MTGGPGPTVDDLSQEVAAQAAGVELVLHKGWLARMEEMFQRRSRIMPPNNRKQAMLPATAEMIDNPVSTACGFAIDIGKGRFFFTLACLGNCTVCSKSKSFHASWPAWYTDSHLFKALSLLWSGGVAR